MRLASGTLQPRLPSSRGGSQSPEIFSLGLRGFFRLAPCLSRLGLLVYARVSTDDQDVAGQELRLRGAGAVKVFTEVRSGCSTDRPGLAALLDYTRRGDTLAVIRLDRLGRSLIELQITF